MTKQNYIKITKNRKLLSKDCKQKIYDILENNEFTEEVKKNIDVIIEEDEALYLANPHYSFNEHITAAFSQLKDMIFKKK